MLKLHLQDDFDPSSQVRPFRCLPLPTAADRTPTSPAPCTPTPELMPGWCASSLTRAQCYELLWGNSTDSLQRSTDAAQVEFASDWPQMASLGLWVFGPLSAQAHSSPRWIQLPADFFHERRFRKGSTRLLT
jgi:hypothetical protein